jgi:ketosteroid isomerase-like protein
MIGAVAVLGLRAHPVIPRWLTALGVVAFAEQAVETITVFGTRGFTAPGADMNVLLGAAPNGGVAVRSRCLGSAPAQPTAQRRANSCRGDVLAASLTTRMDYGRDTLVNARRTPAEVSHRFAEAINAGDLEGALACWSPAAVIAGDDGSHIRGHAALRERFRALIAVGAQLQIAVSDEVCTELGATAFTQMTMTVWDKGEPSVVEGAAAVAYVPGQGGLQILIDHLGREAI